MQISRPIFYNFCVNSADYKYPSPIVVNFLRFIAHTLCKVLWRIEFRGTENIPQKLEGGLLITPNHQTYMDPVWVCLKITRNLRFMAWDKAFDWVLIGRLIRYLGAFPVSLANRRKAIKASRKAIQVLRQGAALIIFPEGEREFADGRMLDFKPGAVRIAFEADVPILPVTIRGGHRVWSQEMKFPRFGKVEIIYHPVLRVPKPDPGVDLREHLNRFNRKLAGIINAELD